MTTSRPAPLVPGDQFHFLKSGFVFRSSEGSYGSETSARAQTVTATATLLELAKDRNGNSWIDLMHDEEAQTARWGQPMFRSGSAPADLSLWQPGTAEEDIARDAARTAAHALPYGAARDAVICAVLHKFGRATTSKTLINYEGN